MLTFLFLYLRLKACFCHLIVPRGDSHRGYTHLHIHMRAPTTGTPTFPLSSTLIGLIYFFWLRSDLCCLSQIRKIEKTKEEIEAMPLLVLMLFQMELNINCFKNLDFGSIAGESGLIRTPFLSFKSAHHWLCWLNTKHFGIIQNGKTKTWH